MDGRTPLIVFACVVIVGLLGVHIITIYTAGKATRFRVGELQEYEIHYQGKKIGSLELHIDNTKIVEGVESYVATYSLYAPGQSRVGRLKFDAEGNLRRAEIAKLKGGILKWRVEVGYSFREDLMRVIVSDNRDPENHRKVDNLIPLEGENIMIPEHVWYYLRAQDIQEDLPQEFRLNLLPNPKWGPIKPAQNIKVRFRVTGSETITTPAGTFKTWIVEGDGTGLASWPIDRLWISKDEGLVVKALEDPGNPVTYELSSKR